MLDIIKGSFLKNYDESSLALDVLKLNESHETDVEKHIRLKAEENERRMAAALEEIEVEKRKARNNYKDPNLTALF